MDIKIETRYERVKRLLDELAQQVINGGAVSFIRSKLELFTDGEEIPCQNWSELNRFLTYVANTNDARGIHQWKEQGRTVKKGSSAFHIFVPLFKTEKDEVTKTDEKVLSGFRLIPVFRVEDTEGRDLSYQQKMKKLDVSKLPLIDVAEKLGLKVVAGIMDGAAGSFSPSAKRIRLNTANPQIFLHELSHAVDHALGNYNSKDYDLGEVVAELSAALLGSLYGLDVDMQTTTAYIQDWSGKGHVMFSVISALSRVEQIYHYIENSRSSRKEETKPMKKKKQKTVEPVSISVLPFKTKELKDRTQIYNEKTGKWVKRDTVTGLFTAVKKDGEPWNRIRKETVPVLTSNQKRGGDYYPAA
ncbi:MAG TPA: hypothetical protein PLU33_11760 [Treponemataceae bacterium]|nr:hypothetical protein [Treponemataceae bacterium]